MTDDLPPFFSAPDSDNDSKSDEDKNSAEEKTSSDSPRILTPAPSINKSQDAPAPVLVMRSSKSTVAAALFFGLVVGSLVVGAMWFYQNKNTYFYKVQNNSSVLAKPRDVQEVLAHIEPATVAVSVKGGIQNGGSAGTGFIYSSDGVVVTNDHVISDSDNDIEVTLADGRTLKGTLLGRDPLQDLAVLKVDATKLPTAKIGSSEKMQVGDDVIAIGNALALEGGLSVTRGIISGLDRTIATQENTELEGILQTDAAINRGNSGGPLVNSEGEVIGINTAIANPTYAQNIGFAIAMDRAKPIIEDLRQGKDRKVAFLGIAAQDVTERIANELDLSVTEGALVVEIQSGSPASKSDLALEDVIIKINDDIIKSANDMVSSIREKKPGDTVTITFDRKGKERTTKVTLVERPL